VEGKVPEIRLGAREEELLAGRVLKGRGPKRVKFRGGLNLKRGNKSGESVCHGNKEGGDIRIKDGPWRYFVGKRG